MLSENNKADVEEILYAIAHIEEYTQSIYTLNELLENTLVYDAVMMNFIIIGEACKRLPKEFKKANPQIDWKGIAGYRNYIAHEYFGVDAKIAWDSIQAELPRLKKELSGILDADN